MKIALSDFPKSWRYPRAWLTSLLAKRPYEAVPDQAAAIDKSRGTLATISVSPSLRIDLALYQRKQPLSRRKADEISRLPEMVRGMLVAEAKA